MTVVAVNGWEMIVTQKVAEDPEERAKVVEVLKEIDRVFDIEKAYEPTLTSV